MNPRPLRTAAEAVEIARSLVGTGRYVLGTGDMDTPRGAPSDCCGFATCKCYGIKRHRPGFNRHADNARGDVEDDINCNSSCDDAERAHDLFVRVKDLPAPENIPRAGDLLKWPTVVLHHDDGSVKFRGTGHEALVESTDRLDAAIAAGLVWDWNAPRYDLLDVIHCHGGPDDQPAISRATGTMWKQHDDLWHLENMRSECLRVVP